MVLVRFATLLLGAAAALPSLAQTPEVFGLPAGQHSVRFQLLEDQDAARVVTAGERGAAHPRAIRTYLWYPAETARAQPKRFGRYAELADDDIWPEEIAGDLRQRLKFANGPLARSLSETDYAALLARPTRAVAYLAASDVSMALLDQAREAMPPVAEESRDDPMLSEFNLGRLCVGLLFTWDLAEQTLPLAEFFVERYPSSPSAKAMLAAVRERAGQSD